MKKTRASLLVCLLLLSVPVCRGGIPWPPLDGHSTPGIPRRGGHGVPPLQDLAQRQRRTDGQQQAPATRPSPSPTPASVQQPSPEPAVITPKIAPAATLQELQSRLSEILAKPELASAMVGVKVVSLEDARRANGMPRRADRADLEDLAWRTVRFAARRTARQARPYGLRLHAAGRPVGKIGSPPYAILTGEPTELLLFVSGRRDAAQVTIEGDAEAIAALEAQASGL